MTKSTGERPFDALLLDLDGVLRVWDPSVTAELEHRYEVPEGTLHRTALEPDLLHRAVVGELSDDEWRRTVAAALLPTYGIEVATDLVADWSEPFGAVDEEVRALVSRVRDAGVTVVLASNATTRLESDLDALDLVDLIDVVVSSARLRVAKPEPTFYFAAAQMASVEVDRCLFVDDEAINVDVARAVGMQAHVYVGIGDLEETLAPVL